MALKEFKFEYELFPDRENLNINKLILLKIKKGMYYLNYCNGDNFHEINISDKVDAFCQGLMAMNINEWNLQYFDEPMDFFPSDFWKLTIISDDINVVCKGKDNFPKNWNEFKILYEIGIPKSKHKSKIPF